MPGCPRAILENIVGARFYILRFLHGRDGSAQGSAVADRGVGRTSVLMAASSLAPRLTDILEAIERIRAGDGGRHRLSMPKFDASQTRAMPPC